MENLDFKKGKFSSLQPCSIFSYTIYDNFTGKLACTQQLLNLVLFVLQWF